MNQNESSHICQEKRKRPRLRRGLAVAALLMLAMVLFVPAQAQELTVSKTIEKSNSKSTASEGLLLGATPTYIDLNGSNGLELIVSRPRTSLFDYTLMFWVRSTKGWLELKESDELKNLKSYLFKLDKGFGCYITRTDQKNRSFIDVYLICEDGDNVETFAIDLFYVPDLESWMHITYSANFQPESSVVKSSAYLRIDLSTFSVVMNSTFIPLVSSKVYYGAGGPKAAENSDKDLGFPGHYRQFWMTVGYIEPENVPFLMNEYKVLDYSTMCYYRFDQNKFISRFEDSFRVQKARALGFLPPFVQENVAAPFCNSIPAKQIRVPQFYKAGGDQFANIRIPRFLYKERNIGYTSSFWLKNLGVHAYESNPSIGRDNNHIFSLEESFSLWYDSPTSFRVYVYAKNNFFETYSDPVFLPLNEWINIQVTISQNTGITVMTFNQNGERQQTVIKDVYLAEQYPKGQISYFQAFIGIPYKLYIWQEYIKLPIDTEDRSNDEALIIAHDFTIYEDGTDQTGFVGWPTLVATNGENLPAVQGEGFDFVSDNVPSAANFKEPQLNGQLQATGTDWDVTCPAPKSSLMYLSGEGVKFDISILIGKTETYTVEFWFKANVTEFQNVSQDRTFLLMLNGRREGISVQQLAQYTINVMTIYVEKGELKCAPFGFSDGQPRDPDSVLTYTGVDPLSVTDWQHISCIYLRQKYVKGQYLAINLEEEGADLSNSPFVQQTLRPKTFVKSIYKQDLSQEILITNFQQSQRWNIILGNNVEKDKFFHGSFKDVRIWKSTRSDTELFSYRFNQAPLQDDLEGNIKFMDGSFDVYNEADTNANGPRYPKNEPSMQLLTTDLTNIICASDTYFNPEQQKCTRYPYTADPSIVYLVSNNKQHGHQLIIERLFQSTMKLPGPKYQPQTYTDWAMILLYERNKLIEKEDTEIRNAADEKYFAKNRGLERYELDPIFMGDYKTFQIEIRSNDIINHNFFVFMKQNIIPRKCLQVLDVQTGDYKVNLRVLLDKIYEKQVFKFQVKRIDGCADEYPNTLQENLEIETQPPIPKRVVDRFLINFDRSAQAFTVTIPVDVINDSQLPKNLPINIIFYLFWKSDSDKLREKVSYMNVVYTLTLATKINVIMEYGGDRVIDTGKGEDLKINTICSDFQVPEGVEESLNCASSQGLSFQWECATYGEYVYPDLAEYCRQWNGSPVLVIPNDLIKRINGLNKPIRIRAVLTSVEASEQTGQAAENLQFKLTDDDETGYADLFTWVTTAKPDFTVVYPQPNNTVLVTREQEIKIVPIGWRPQDGYKISFSAIDEIGNNVDFQNQNIGIVQTVPKNVLRQDTKYSLTVTVSKETDKEQALLGLATSATVVSEFRTGVIPPIPKIAIEPGIGVMYSTLFTVKVQVANPQLHEYRVIGLLADGTELRLTDKYINVAEQPTFTAKLPQLSEISIAVRNSFGEIQNVKAPVIVAKSEPNGSPATWLSILQQNQIGSIDSIYQRYLFIVGDANIDASNIMKKASATLEEKNEAMRDARDVNAELASKVFAAIRLISKQTVKKEEQKQVEYIVRIIATMGKFSQFLEPPGKADPVPNDMIRVIQMCIETLEYVLRIEFVMKNINVDPFQRINLVKALGRITAVTAERAHIQKALLQYDEDWQPELAWTKGEEDVSQVTEIEAEPKDEAEELAEEAELEDEEETALRFLSDDWVGEPYSHEELRRRQLKKIKEATILKLQNLTPLGQEYKEIEDKNQQWNKDLLEMYRDLLMKITVIRNTHMDQMCLMDEAENVLTITTDKLQQSVSRIASDSISVIDQEFTYTVDNGEGKQNTNIKAKFPTKAMLAAEKERFGVENFNWLCVQVSFMQSSPVAGFEPRTSQQFFFEHQPIIQVKTVDSNDFRLLSFKNQTAFKDSSIEIKFEQSMRQRHFFFNNQTFCSSYDNTVATGNNLWTDKKYDWEGQEEALDCTHVYDQAAIDDKQVGDITCTCNYVTSFYYTLMNDISRKRYAPYIPQNKTHTILTAITLFLVIFGVLMPCLMIFLDAKDYQNVEDNVYPVDDLTIAQLELARNALCVQEIYYREKEIAQYLTLEANDFRSGSGVAFVIFHRTLHPLFSLFTHFDYRKKRVTRFAFFLGQISLITILLWVCYSIPFTERIADTLGMEEEIVMERRWFFIQIFLSFIMLPMPDRCCCFFKTAMYMVNDESMTPLQYAQAVEDLRLGIVKKKEEETEVEDKALLSARSGSSKLAHEDEKKAKALKDGEEEDEIIDPEKFVRPALFDRFLWCKLVGLLLIFGFWVFAIYLTIKLGTISGIEYVGDEYLENEMKRFIFLNSEQANEFVFSWFMTIFVWGTLLNEVRILIISLIAPINGQALYDKQMEMMKDPEALKKFHGGYCEQASCTTCCLIPPEAVQIALDVIFTVDIKLNEKDQTGKYLVREEERKRFEFAKAVAIKLKLDQENSKAQISAPVNVDEEKVEKPKKKKGGPKSVGSAKSGKSKKSDGKKKKGKKKGV